MARKVKKIKTHGKQLYTELEPLQPWIPGKTPEERFKNAASMVYRDWDHNPKK